MFGNVCLALICCFALSQALPDHPLPGYPIAHGSSRTCPSLWARVSPEPGAVIVDRNTHLYPGSFSTVQEGVIALNHSTTQEQNLFMFPGTYVEQVYIPYLMSNLTV